MKKTRHLFYALLAIMALVLITGVMEMYLEGRFNEAHSDLKEDCLRRSNIPQLIYEGNPGECGNNSLGFPDREYVSLKAPGVFRIIVVGDSVAAGFGVSKEEKFPAVLEAILDREVGGEFEIFVLARSGYSTSQELVLLERQAMTLNPDLIIWSYCLNDPAHPIFHDADGGTGWYYHEPRCHLLHAVSKHYFKARENILKKGCGEEFHEMLHCVYSDDVASQIKAIGDITSRRTVPVLFVIHPNIVRFEEYPFSAIHARLQRLARENGLRVLDLLESYRMEGRDSIALTHGDPWHPNARGHRLAAEAVFEDLGRQGLPGISLRP